MVRFTAAMEDFDETRSVREFLPVSDGPSSLGGPRNPRGQEERRGEELVGQGAEREVRVRARTADGQAAVRAEMQLLAALEVAGLAAAPAVLRIEDEGYVRESAQPLASRSGRRAAGTGSPATAERAALGRARDELDALVDALHERCWLLGAHPGGGLGMRQDGSVILLDLEGLRPGEGLAERRADRRWVDSVLCDEQRTLRRRVHDTAVEVAGPVPVPSAAGSPGEDGENGEAGDRPMPGAIAAAPTTPVPAPRPARARARAHGEHRAPIRGRAEHPAGDEHAGGGHQDGRRAAARDVLRTIREVISQRGLRRTSALTAAAVVAVGTLLGTSSWLLLAPAGEVEPIPRAAASSTGASSTAAPAPEITDPWVLAAELAGARHAYVTGLTAHPAAAPRSRALADDQQVRQAYQGLSVTGGGAVIHEARVLEGPGADGRAVLEVTSSTEEYEVEQSDGSVRTVAASEPVDLVLTLRWDGAQWLVVTARAVGPATAP